MVLRRSFESPVLEFASDEKTNKLSANRITIQSRNSNTVAYIRATTHRIASHCCNVAIAHATSTQAGRQRTMRMHQRSSEVEFALHRVESFAQSRRHRSARNATQRNDRWRTHKEVTRTICIVRSRRAMHWHALTDFRSHSLPQSPSRRHHALHFCPPPLSARVMRVHQYLRVARTDVEQCGLFRSVDSTSHDITSQRETERSVAHIKRERCDAMRSSQ